MSDYPPPRENVPIFDSTLFGPRGGNINTGGGGGGGDGITEAEADGLYLKWPSGQSVPTGETMNGPTFMTSVLQVAGATTLSSTASVSQDLTVGQDIIMSGTAGTNYLQFPDLTQQFTGFIPIVPPIPAGSYTNSSIVVNSFGQVTSASSGSGGGGIISQTFITAADIGIGSPAPVIVPSNTTRVKIIACSGGGAQGSDFFDGTTMYAGGSGAAGSMATVNLNMSLFNAAVNFVNYLNISFTAPVNSGQGLTASVNWTPQAVAYFTTEFLPQSTLLNGNILTLYGGLAGQNGSAGSSGAGGTNPPIASQILMSSTNASLITIFGQGQNGSSLAPFSGSAAQPQPTCPMADFNLLSTTLNSYVRGGYSTYSANTPTPVFQGIGGFVITFYA
jgi:hypothetical protein